MALRLSELEINLPAKFSVRLSAPPVGLLTEIFFVDRGQREMKWLNH